MSNKDIVKLLKRTVTLMDLHDENQFKIRSFNNAAFNLERIDIDLETLSISDLEQLEGVGKSIATVIEEIRETGSFPLLNELQAKTPPEVLEMTEIKGIGPKKIRTIWKELHIETIDALIQACENGEIAKLKGFGEKTQETIQKALEYKLANIGKFYYADVKPIADLLLSQITTRFPNALVSVTGDYRRKLEVIDMLEFIIGDSQIKTVIDFINSIQDLEHNVKNSGPFTWNGRYQPTGLAIKCYVCRREEYYNKLLIHTGSEAHLARMVADGKNLYMAALEEKFDAEQAIYDHLQFQFVPPELREGFFEIELSREKKLPELIRYEDLKGTFHNHTNYSDGKNNLTDMAQACIDKGFEYLGISDHSQSAFYANGLQAFRIEKQHHEIDALNDSLAPFRIFKGIESDILNDGSLDYNEEVLSSFDFVVASIHSNLNMDSNKATQRLLKAIENPFTTFLGHPTGRLLLKREGYPIDHKTIIEACAEYGVIIEVNANPWRLDIDWRWINFAVEKGVLLSINPDAHEINGLDDMYFGVCVARKGGLTKENTFNAWSLDKVKKHLKTRKEKIL